MSPNDSNDLYVASEDAAPTPPDWMLTDEALIAESMGFDPRQDIASEDAAADAGQLVRDTEIARDAAVDREIAAVDLVLMAARETARGVRTVRG